MKRHHIALIILVLISVIGLFLGFWWLFAIGAFVYGVLSNQKGVKSFLIPFFILFITWFSLAFINDGQFAQKPSVIIGDLLNLPSGVFTLLIAGLIPGILGGIISLGTSFIFQKNNFR